MIRRPRSILIFLIILLLGFSSLATAEVEKSVAKTMALDSTPVDMTVSADGKYTFVLVQGGKVLIYDSAGALKDTLEVSKSVVSIGSSPNGDFILLADSEKKTLEIVKLDYVVDIDISGLPFKGPENAPVLIAVFNDYQ
jgi:DNA-binding beta-propeller fold protein YncE